jgi:hypothetical protein
MNDGGFIVVGIRGLRDDALSRRLVGDENTGALGLVWDRRLDHRVPIRLGFVETGATGSLALDAASEEPAGAPGLAIARRLLTPGRMLSSTTSCVRCFSKCRLTRSMASGSTELIWFRTSAIPMA